MRNRGNQIIERLESRQFLSSAPDPRSGTFAVATGSSDAESDEVELAGHVMDYAANKGRAATGDGPPGPGQAAAFSLDEALREMAAAFEQTLADAPEERPDSLPWSSRSRPEFME